jgi:hypothetical protein
MPTGTSLLIPGLEENEQHQGRPSEDTHLQAWKNSEDISSLPGLESSAALRNSSDEMYFLRTQRHLPNDGYFDDPAHYSTMMSRPLSAVNKSFPAGLENIEIQHQISQQQSYDEDLRQYNQSEIDPALWFPPNVASSMTSSPAMPVSGQGLVMNEMAAAPPNYEFSIWDWMLPGLMPAMPEIPENSVNSKLHGVLQDGNLTNDQPQGYGLRRNETTEIAGESAGKSAAQWPIHWDPDMSDNAIRFPDMASVATDILDIEDFAHVDSITPDCYAKISSSMKRHTEGAGHFRSFINGNLASFETLNIFVQLYFEYFHSSFPILHQATFATATTPWHLILSIAAIGCRYSKLSQAAQYANCLQELQRRSLADAVCT